jgi:FkbM family methyltransferase
MLRKLAIQLLKIFNPGDITIRHHYTGDKLKLHSFKHKGYWFHGRSRERLTMELFRELVEPGNFVMEVGGHIGYISLHLASLVGRSGRVLVFEPGENNLSYLRRNIAGKPHVTLVEKAASNQNGVAQFRLESLTGQNNSLLTEYRVLEDNMRSAGVSNVETSVVSVDCVRIDDFIAQNGLSAPTLIKIDIEGAEHMALQGLVKTLRQRGVAIMVEVTENQPEVFRMLVDAGYRLFNDQRVELHAAEELQGNVFCLQINDARISRVFQRQAA